MTTGSDGLFSGMRFGAVERVMAGIVLARAPGVELRLRGLVERRRQRDDRADVQVGVRPAVEPPADAGRRASRPPSSDRARR